MSTYFTVVIGRALDVQVLLTSENVGDALQAIAALSALVPDLRITLYISQLGSGPVRALQVVDGHWVARASWADSSPEQAVA